MDEPTYLAPGVVLAARYGIAEEIGRGGFSVVYRARDRHLDADVAIKLLVPPPAAARLARERLRREVQAVRRLSHPNIVTVYDVVDDGPWSFVVMEYVPGPDLAVHVRRRGALDAEAAARLGAEVAAALEAAHRQGILHRDVKPQNILLAPDGRARLTDFGSARLAGLESVTQTGGLVGTLDYAAPELLAGRRGDARADVFALGVTLYYALTAELPPRFPAATGHRPRGRRPDVPPWLDHVVGRATTADPDDRFPSVGLLAVALERRDNALEPEPVPGRRERCALCDAVEPFGIGVCPRCTRRFTAASDVLIFLSRTSAGPAWRAMREALEQRLGGAAPASALAAALGGKRPLLAVPADAAVRVVELLEARGLTAHTENRGPAWHAAVPLPIVGFAVFVAMAGLAAAYAAATPTLLITSPAMAGGLLMMAAVLRRTPVWKPPAGRPPVLSPAAQREAVVTLAALPAGSARSLLLDLLHRAMPARLGPDGDRLSPLVVAACGAARDLAALEGHLAAFDARRDQLPDASGSWLDAQARCERGRDLLTHRLLEASAALSGRQALAIESDRAEWLGELTRELGEETRRQEDAAREVAELLS